MSKVKPYQHWPIPRVVFLEGETDRLEQICSNQTSLIHRLRRIVEEQTNSFYDASTDQFRSVSGKVISV